MNIPRLILFWTLATATIFMAIVARPLCAQQKALPRVGIISPHVASLEMLRDELRQRGYVDGESIAMDWRLFAAWDGTMRELAFELVRSNPDLIVVYGTPATRAILDATKTLPVVFAAGDPVGSGLVSSLSRPGGNATGVSVIVVDVVRKLLDLLIQLKPSTRKIAVIRNPSNPLGMRIVEELKRLAQTLPVQLQIVDARTVDELEKRVRAIRRDRPDSILITADLVFYADKDRVVRAVRSTGLPAIFQDRVFVEAGGLMSYGADEKEINRTLAAQVDKILKGARPGELPVEQVTKLELSINLKTANILGIAFPQSILLRADEVIR